MKKLSEIQLSSRTPGHIEYFDDVYILMMYNQFIMDCETITCITAG